MPNSCGSVLCGEKTFTLTLEPFILIVFNARDIIHFLWQIDREPEEFENALSRVLLAAADIHPTDIRVEVSLRKPPLKGPAGSCRHPSHRHQSWGEFESELCVVFLTTADIHPSDIRVEVSWRANSVWSLGQLLRPIVPWAQKKKTKRAAGSPAASTQLALCLRLASMYKAESWQPSMTRPHNADYVKTGVACQPLYCVRVIIVRLN